MCTFGNDGNDVDKTKQESCSQVTNSNLPLKVSKELSPAPIQVFFADFRQMH